MSFETRYSLAQIEKSYRQGQNCVHADNMGTFADERRQELERKTIPWLNAYSGPQGGTNGETRPAVWTEGDSFLRKQIGTKVFYDERKVYPSGEHVILKTVGRYSSPLVQSKLHTQKKHALSEQFLMENVDYVDDSLDLRKTEITTLPKLQYVGGNLTLDTNSMLETMPALKIVKGKISVVAKDKEEMNNYLKSIGLMDKKNNLTVRAKGEPELVMRSYI